MFLYCRCFTESGGSSKGGSSKGGSSKGGSTGGGSSKGAVFYEPEEHVDPGFFYDPRHHQSSASSQGNLESVAIAILCFYIVGLFH